MKKHHFKRPLSMLMAVSMVAAMTAGSIATVYAGGDTLPARPGEAGYKGENQPSAHGYRAKDLLDWTPETDADARFMRAQVPQQEKIAPFAATQANPKLVEEVKSLQLSSDYGNGFFDAYQYNDQFSDYCFNFWQYVDYSASWHGMVTEPAPNSLFDPEAGWWERAYEFGTLNLPNPAYTNAAHKNGSQSLGCLFLPREGQHTQLLVNKDENGNFPIADKLIEMADYYGFDGYFINAEERLPGDFMPLYDEFVSYMTARGLYIQVYASNPYGQNNQGSWGGIDYYNKDATVFSNWVKKPGSPQGASSLYMNPDPSKSHVNGSVNIMNSLGLDARNTVFNTLEAGQTGFSGTRGSLYNTYDENLVPRTGIASLGASMVYTGLDESLFGHTGNNSYNENKRGDADYQKYVFARERTWWSGAPDAPHYSDGTGVPASQELLNQVVNATPDPVATANDPKRANSTAWLGMSAFISERSVIGGSAFSTNFNTGHGMQYFVDGAVSNDNQWANINIQDIPPSWQWWIDTEGTRLYTEFDYGEKYNKNQMQDYTQVGGYNGGSSLVVSGDLDAENTLRLFKSDLAVKEDTKVSVTYNKASVTDSSKMELAVIFKNDPETVITFNIPNANKQTDGWVTKNVSLGDYAGEEIAMMGFTFDPGKTAIENYQMNIGELKVTDGKDYTPAKPTGFQIDKAFDSTEMYLSWDLADYDSVQKYNVYAELSDGQEVYLGGTYDDAFYVKSLYGEDKNVTLKLTAVGKDGSESEAAELTYDFSNEVKNIQVEEKAGYLDVSWENPDQKDYDSLSLDVTFDYSTKPESYSMNVNKEADKTRMVVPIADGSKYTLTVSTVKDGVKSAAIAKSGALLDLYSAPYTGYAMINGKADYYGNIQPSMSPPVSNDWWKMLLYKNGELQQTVIRGKEDLPTADRADGCDVVLMDYAGNLSEPSTFYKNQAEDAEITRDMIPDEALFNAVTTQAGTTTAQAKAFTGTLDLSGSAVANLKGISLLSNMKGLNLENCTSLIEVPSGIFDGMTQLSEINIAGCTGLQTLMINGTGLEKVNYTDLSNFENLLVLDLSNNRLDMSEGTPERALAGQAGQAASYDNQRPQLYPGVEEKLYLDKKNNGKAFDLNGYYQDCLDSAVSTRGTAREDMESADFIADGYDWSTAMETKEVHQILITDANGNVTMDTIETNKDGVYTVEYITYDDADYHGNTMFTQKVYVRAVTSILEQTIGNAEKLIADGALDNTMEAVVTEFYAALENAKDIAAKDGATQEEVNAATIRLLSVMAKVDWKQGDKTNLEIAIAVAETIEPNLDLYVEAGKQEFIDALAVARELMESGNAWDDDIQAATTRLVDAMSKLAMKPNKDILNGMIENAKTYDLSAYTEDSAEAVRTALADAEALAADENATQAAVDAAADTLQAALNGLTVKSGEDANTDRNGNTNSVTTAPVGDGSAPTKTGDNGISGLGVLALVSAAGAMWVLRKKNTRS